MDSSKKRTLGILITAAVGLIACGVRLYYEYRSPPAVVFRNSDSAAQSSLIDDNTNPSETIVNRSDLEDKGALETVFTEETKPEPIPIYLCGAVEKPGVYYVEINTFLFELIERAGGLKPDAASNHINMVMELVVPVSVYIPSLQEMNDEEPALSHVKTPGFIRNSADDYIWGETSSEDPDSSGDEKESQKININTADESELTKLSGIGEVTASAIVRFRTDNGTFAKIEDIMKVPGIKQGRFDAIKDMIEV